MTKKKNKSSSSEERMFSSSKAADILQLDLRTLKVYENKKVLLPTKIVSMRRYYSQNDIEKGKFVKYLAQDIGINFIGIKLILCFLEKQNIPPAEYIEYTETTLQTYIEEMQKSEEPEQEEEEEVSPEAFPDEALEEEVSTENLSALEIFIRKKLKVFNLSKSQLDKITAAALKQSRIIFKDKEIDTDSEFFDFEGKINKIVKRFSKDGLTYKDYLKTASGEPGIFIQPPEKIEKSISEVVDKFKEEGLTAKAYLNAALRHPRLFLYYSSTIEKNILAFTEKFKDKGLTTKTYLKAALRSPTLFTRSPDSVERNITEVPERFKDYGITINDYLKAALKYPPLFICTPETTAEHIVIIFELFDEGIIAGADSKELFLKYLLQKYPQALIFSNANLNFRREYAYITRANPTTKVLLKSRVRIEKEIVKVLTSQDPDIKTPIPVEERLNVLRDLVQQGKVRKELLKDIEGAEGLLV